MTLQSALAWIFTIGIVYGLWVLVGKALLDQAIQTHRLIQKYRKEHPDV